MKKCCKLYCSAASLLDKFFNPVLGLVARIWVGTVFFRSGLLKIQNWDNTIYLFEEEYSVPLLSPTLAAYMGTAGELILPVLLILGIVSRLSALGLFLLNAVAVLSYPALWDGGYYDHKLWGLFLLITIIYGPGKASFDYWFCRKDCCS